ncbi:MAG: YncE family protein [Bryobacterales bacterium]|nr:YncE family protein [Bryobacterales bacterium]
MRERSHSRADRPTTLTAAGLLACGLLAGAGEPRLGRQPDGSILLPTGQRLTPAGEQLATASLPIAVEPSNDGRYLLVLQAGYETPVLSAIDVETNALTGQAELADAWLGLAIHPSGERIYVGGGIRGSVWELSFGDGALRHAREFSLGSPCRGRCDSLIGDVLLDGDGRLLYALDVLRDRIVVINTQSGLVLGEIATGAAPYRIRLTPDREHLVVSHWGEASLGLYRLSDRRMVERVPVGEHPTDIRIVPGLVRDPRAPDDAEGREFVARLFVACAHADNLWTLGIAEGPRFEFLDARSVAPLPGSPLGSLPTALALDRDNRTLYVANSGNNILLVVNIEEALPEPAGAIPTGWFPSAVAPLPGGGLAYLSGKGDGERGGLLGVLPPLTAEQLDMLTAAAVANIPAQAPAAAAAPTGVRHVTLVLSDARGPSWRNLRSRGASLEGFVPTAKSRLEQTAVLTGGMESDFFTKLGPAVHANRAAARALAAAGRAALPAAGTVWSNAQQAGLAAVPYGIGGGPPPSAFISSVRAGSELPHLAVVRLAGSPDSQDRELGQLADALREHPLYSGSVLFVIPTEYQLGAVAAGGIVRRGSSPAGLVSVPSVLRTVVWLLGLRPMTQLVTAAEPLAGLFVGTP